MYHQVLQKKRSSLCILRPTTQTVSWGLDQELGEEVLRLAADRLREPHVLHQDQLEQDVVVSVKHKIGNDKTITMMKIKVFELACCRMVTCYYYYYSFYYYLLVRFPNPLAPDICQSGKPTTTCLL